MYCLCTYSIVNFCSTWLLYRKCKLVLDSIHILVLSRINIPGTYHFLKIMKVSNLSLFQCSWLKLKGRCVKNVLEQVMTWQYMHSD